MTEQKLNRLEIFLNKIFLPASKEFDNKLSRNALALHDAFSMASLIAHTLDQIAICSKKLRCLGIRKEQVIKFDELFQVEGARFQNSKFRIVNAVNNAFKHGYLNDRNEYDLLKKEYGLYDFTVLIEKEGKIFFRSNSYQFDFARVILRPILNEITCLYQSDNCPNINYERSFGLIEYIDDKICEDGSIKQYPTITLADYDEEDPIDQMIQHCNPLCMDCGELEEDCECPTFLYGSETGEFSPEKDPFFNFDSVMSQISGAYKK